MRRIVLAATIAALAAGIMPVRAVTAPAPIGAEMPEPSSDGTIDVRFDRPVAPRPDAVRAAAALAREVPTLEVTWNERFGTAKHVFADGFLTPSAGSTVGKASAERIARDFVARTRTMFGLSADAVRTLVTVQNNKLPGAGPFAVVFRMVYGGIPTFSGGNVAVNVTTDGRVLTAWGDTGPSGTLRGVTPRLSASGALAALARYEKLSGFAPAIHGVDHTRADRLTIFESGGLAHRHNARLVAFPTASGPRLAWRVFLAKGEHEMLSTAIDAADGALLFRHNQVAHAEGRVFLNYPGAPRGGVQEMVSLDGDRVASPLGWVGVPLGPDQAAPAITTAGNNAFAWTDWGEYKAAPPAAPSLLGVQNNPFPEYAPVAPDGSFDYAFANSWGNACTPTVTPAPASRTIENPSYVQDRDASVTNIFYLVNRIHDLAYKYGFDEEAGNFQQENFGRGGAAFDAVRYQAMAGIANNSLNNANMFTPVDGGEPAQLVLDSAANPTRPRIVDYVPPRGNMYLWRPIPGFTAPCADGDQDASIAWHEYTHGITNRMVGAPDDSDALGAPQSGAMGEAWSDWVAMNFLFMLGLETRPVEGIYATGNAETGIRNYSLGKNPLTYGDFGYGPTGPQVHADGEIWSSTLWDLRTALQKSMGAKPGEQVATHLVFDALDLSPRLPTYLDMRNAIIAADRASYRGKHIPLIWSVFARKGMGASAKADGATDVLPTPGFDVPGAGNATLRGTVADADGGVLPGAGIVIGGVAEGQPNPVVVTNRAGQFAAKLQPGSYKVTIVAPGYGLQGVGAVTVTRGQTVVRAFKVSKNLASVGYGGAVTSGLSAGDPGLALIDDRESSGQAVTVGKPVVIRLGGTGVATVRGMSIAHRPSSNSRLRTPLKYTIESSTDGRAWKRVRVGGASKARGVKPRPRTSDWTRLVFSTPGLKARFVRLTVNEVLNGGTIGALGDIEVFGSAPGARPSGAGREAPFTSSGTIAASNAGADTAGVSLAMWQNTCETPPDPIQGLDSFFVQLPANAGDGLHFFELKNKGGTGTDLDAYYYASDCATLLGGAATSAASEQGSLPAGSRWVQILLWAGTTDGFDVRVTTTLKPVTPPRR